MGSNPTSPSNDEATVRPDRGKRSYTKRKRRGGGNFLPPGKVQLVLASFRDSRGVRETANRLGLAKNTVARYYKLHGPFRCACGAELTHNGWCAVRLARSRPRREYLRQVRGEAPSRIVFRILSDDDISSRALSSIGRAPDS